MKKILLLLFICSCFSLVAQKRIIGANVTTILAGEEIPNWSLVYIRGGVAFKAENTVISNAATGIAIDTALFAGDTIQVAFSGTLVGFDVAKGAQLNLGASGVLTTAKPTSGFVQKVGDWVADSSIRINIQNPIQIQNTETFINLSGDISNSTVTPSDITGFSFTAEANTSYVVRLYGLATFAATTTGIGIVADAPDGATVVSGRVTNQLASQTLASMQQTIDGSIAGTTTTNGTGTSGNPAIALTTYVEGVWLVSVVTGGTVKLRFRSEIATSNVTVKAGSKMSYLKI